jgi:hypothetical protein
MLSYQYSRGRAPWVVEVKQGNFLTEEEWRDSWNDNDDDDDDDDGDNDNDGHSAM